MRRPPSHLIDSSRGPVEYAIHSTGPAVVVSHGTGGGYDQGLVLSRLLSGYQGVAISRAGYLRTPLETGRTPAEMADACALLLDALRVAKAAILGLSGGGMCAAHFALQHPDRCWGLILADAIAKTPPGSSVEMVRRANSLPDALAWFLTRLAIHVGLPLMIRDVETRSLMRVFFENNPISERRAGVQNDLEQIHAMDGFAWEEIRVPTLLTHGDRDRLIPLGYRQEVSHRVKGSELAIVQGGGHECLLSHHVYVAPILQAFLGRAFENKAT